MPLAAGGRYRTTDIHFLASTAPVNSRRHCRRARNAGRRPLLSHAAAEQHAIEDRHLHRLTSDILPVDARPQVNA